VTPGGIKRISVAVALSAEAMAKSKPAEVQKLKSLVSAAVGAVPERGDQVEVIVRSFAETNIEQPAFYETGWFAMIVRYMAALIGVLLVLLLGVRPILKALRGRGSGQKAEPTGEFASEGMGNTTADQDRPVEPIDRSLLNRQVGAAQKFAEERPDRAVIAIRQMLNQSQ
jgi:flagellar M-ring protein FliF